MFVRFLQAEDVTGTPALELSSLLGLMDSPECRGARSGKNGSSISELACAATTCTPRLSIACVYTLSLAVVSVPQRCLAPASYLPGCSREHRHFLPTSDGLHPCLPLRIASLKPRMIGVANDCKPFDHP